MLSLLRILFISTFLVSVFVGCSNNAMYQSGKLLDKLAPRGTIRGVMGLVTAPLKYNQQQENKKIAEEKRLRRKIEKERKRAEAIKWFNSLSREDQVKVIAMQEKAKQVRLKQQAERARLGAAIIGSMLGGGSAGNSSYDGGPSTEQRMRDSRVSPSGRFID